MIHSPLRYITTPLQCRKRPYAIWRNQVEGGNTNNDVWLYEHVPDTMYAESSGDACDHYNRYRSDIALLASLGLNAYRFSLEWSRIESAPGEFSVVAIAHYRDMLHAYHEHGLTPIVTYHHSVDRKSVV